MTPKSIIPWYQGPWDTGPLAVRSVARPNTTSSPATRPLLALQQEMQAMIENFFAGSGFSGSGPLSLQSNFPGNRSFSPQIDVVEEDDKLTVSVELPGLDQKDIEISLDGDFLHIKGEKREEHEEKSNKNFYYVERAYGAFERTVPLNVEIEEDQISASFKKGVLKIELPKTKNSKERKKRISVA